MRVKKTKKNKQKKKHMKNTWNMKHETWNMKHEKHMKACRMGTVFLVYFEQNHMTVCFPPLTVQYNSYHWLSGIFSRTHSLKLEWLLHVTLVLFIPEIKFKLLKCYKSLCFKCATKQSIRNTKYYAYNFQISAINPLKRTTFLFNSFELPTIDEISGASCINLATMLRLCLKNNFDQLAVANG